MVRGRCRLGKRMSSVAKPQASKKHSAATLTLDDAICESIRLKAMAISHGAGLTRSDVPDLEQDIALHVWQRLNQFDPAKAEAGVFTRMLVAHATATVLRGQRRRLCRAPRSLEAVLRQTGGDTDELTDLDSSKRKEASALALDVAAVLAKLPRQLRRVAKSLRARSITEAAKHLGISRATMYCRLEELRQAFVAADLENYL
jgi:DNA-directed RNA polymerase specialized sigma24 family protein